MSWKVEIQQYKVYLRGKKFSEESVKRYSRMLIYYLDWKERKGLQQESYNDLLDYIQHCQKDGKSSLRINKYLLAIRHWMDQEIEHFGSAQCKEGGRQDNPARGLQVRGVHQKVIRGMLKRKELEELEKKYSEIGRKERQLILSLVIHQAMSISEIERMEARHLDLKKGSIYIPSGRKSNSRTLKLEASQILSLMEVKEEAKRMKRVKLIGLKSMRNTGTAICKQLKKLDPRVRNLRQLRASVISDWLLTENLRQVQYKAGHKHVMSTERYQRHQLEGLKQQLGKHHPMN